ncbi:MAG: hypothetical protein V1887_04075 [Candidatus Aenigmatarchaeota archaeon]
MPDRSASATYSFDRTRQVLPAPWSPDDIVRETALACHFEALKKAGVISDYQYDFKNGDVNFTFTHKGRLPRYVERGLIEIYQGKRIRR